MTRLTRRQFMRAAGAAAASAWLVGTGCAPQPSATAKPPAAPPTPTVQPSELAAVRGDDAATTEPPAVLPEPTAQPADLAVARGGDPAAITQAALAALGGINRFVKPGQEVVIKPNICVAYHPPEYAATTNPAVVAALVRLCLGAGAARVRVMDNPFGGTAEAAYAISGIAEAVSAASGEMEVMSPVKYAEFPIPGGKDITAWKVYRDALETDVLINVPIAKHHSLARLTLGGKNLLGLVATPNQFHRNLGQRIADLASLFRPTLTVVDAVRILTAHGPSGGSLDDVKQTNTVIASPDMVAADAYATTLFGLTGSDISYIQAATDMGLGRMDLSSLKVEEVTL